VAREVEEAALFLLGFFLARRHRTCGVVEGGEEVLVGLHASLLKSSLNLVVLERRCFLAEGGIEIRPLLRVVGGRVVTTSSIYHFDVVLSFGLLP